MTDLIWLSRDKCGDFICWHTQRPTMNPDGYWHRDACYHSTVDGKCPPADAHNIQPGRCGGPYQWKGNDLVRVIEPAEVQTVTLECIVHDGSPSSMRRIQARWPNPDAAAWSGVPRLYVQYANGHVASYNRTDAKQRFGIDLPE